MPSSPLRLVVAGAGPAYSDRPGSLGSAYVVVAPGGASVVLDLGQGTFPNLFRAVRPESVEAILISHLHPDHFVDLVPLRHYLRFELGGHAEVRVAAPAELAARLDALSGEADFADAALAIEPLATGAVSVGGGLAVEATRVAHRGEAYAFRVSRQSGGPGLVYSGDCGRASDLEPLVRPGDTLLTEVSFGTGPAPVPDMHLDAVAVAGLAARTGAGRVLLTHLQMGYDRGATMAAVRSGFAGPVGLVDPGDSFDIVG
ncbi:MAG TPA: MBL fold metallo-hydrolase [Candidatus Limnocylindrales bacterium]|nr:MBL fold metallo-hydrolase [Candidatus Limnocylindrales bacterium]